jgi:hypothetical protein
MWLGKQTKMSLLSVCTTFFKAPLTGVTI